MGIKLVTFAAQTVTPQDDALIYETALQESGMIYGGAVTIKNANVLHVDAGHGALCGRKFTIEATDVPVPLTASGSLQGRIYIHMDLSDTGEPISFQVETASSLTPVIQQADVNINSGIYEINLATFIVDTSTISNLVNVAPFIDIEPDSGFNAQSNNPVQNKVITKAVGVPETIGGLASQEYNIGDTLVATDGQFYDVIAHISQNATIVLNGNVTLGGNIVDLINSLSSQISNFKYKRITNGAVPISTPITIANLYSYEEIVVKTWNSTSGWGHTMSFMPNLEHLHGGYMSQSASTYAAPDYWMYDYVYINATTGELGITATGGSGRVSDLISVFGRLG